MATRAAIRSANSSDVEACLQTLTRAFEADPVCNWAWPNRAAYRSAFPGFCMAFGGAAFEGGTAHVDADECKGVALWLAPGAAPDEERLIQLIRETVPERRQEALFSIFEQMDAYHPKQPHWHLPLIGVAPDMQGQGVGSMLLEHALRHCDEASILAYLEATSPASMRLYQRHGFKALGNVQAGDSPEIVPMTRIPSG